MKSINENITNVLPNFLSNLKVQNNVFPYIHYIISDATIASNNPKFCPICFTNSLNYFSPDSCSHYFCKKCIFIWSKIRKSCPICRRSFKNIIKIST